MARRPRKTARFCGAALLTISMVAGMAPGALPAEPVRRDRVVLFQDEGHALRDFDRRAGRIAPTLTQRKIVAGLGGTARWNRFGTPLSLISYEGYLDRGLAGSPAHAAREWVAQHRELFRLSDADLSGLRLQHVLPIGDGWSVQFRQTYGGIESVVDGRITLALDGDKLAYVSSSAAPGSPLATTPRISATDAVLAAASDVDFGLRASDLTSPETDRDWTVFATEVISEPARARLRALPTPHDGIRLVYETLLIDNDHSHGHPEAWVHFVDALTGRPLRRESRIQFEKAPEPPTWSVYTNTPPLDYAKPGKRVLWCWADAKGCERGLKNKGAYGPWDTIPGAGAPTFTTSGNAAKSAQSWISPLTPGEQYAPASPTREYTFPFTNQWYETGCNPASMATPERIDVDAATANLFAMHNRLHDWSYMLGFTEEAYNLQVVNRQSDQSDAEGNDPEIGNSQAGAMFGTGTPLYGRDNANQITPQDGVPPITNMYLWQPIGASFYPPCVDGDFDMAVIGHEYTHAISNRMVAGPDSGLSGPQSGAMGESWSDLTAVEYLQEYGFAPVGKENPFAVGAYVTGDLETAIRNYGMNNSPLNYSNIAYDFVGAQVHADGEIWSATNFSLREALVRRYNDRFPESDRALQRACADGKVDADRCPGNRRWIQIVFDAFKLMESGVSMVDARDAYLAADKVRFDSANRDLLWREFARRGLGKKAKSNGAADEQPRPSFEDPTGPNGDVTFRLVTETGKAIDGQVFVGDYEARSAPIVSTDDAKETMTPGRYDFVAQASGYGMKRFSADIDPGSQTVTVKMPLNLASGENGAKATGDGAGWGALIDDTEASNWTSDEGPVVEGKQVTVDLAGGKHLIDTVNVSAMLNPSGGQNRFSALRSFAIEVCSGKCKNADEFKRIYTSKKNAFPAVPPRPKAPHLILRSFDVPNVTATHVRLVVLTNQCTGVKEFRKENDNDATKRSTCLVGYEPLVPGQPDIVRAAEFQVFAP